MLFYFIFCISFYNEATKENHKIILDNLDKHIKRFNTINVNSGSILNSLFHTFSVMKMIFDDIFEIEDTEYAAADYYLNTYYIGNMFNAHIFNEFKNNIKSNYKSVNGTSKSSIMVKTRKQELEKKDKLFLISHSKLDLLSQNYVDKGIDWELFDHYYTQKLSFDYKNEEIDYLSILKLFNDYANKYLSALKVGNIDKIIEEFKVYITSNRLHNQRAYTKFLGQDSLIYIAGDYTSIQRVHLLIHELLHSFCYSISSNNYVHESFVRYHHLNFLIQNKYNNQVPPLIDYMLFETYSSFVIYHVALGYEISLIKEETVTFLERIKSYTKCDREIEDIISNYVSYSEPLKSLKYYHAIAETAPLFAVLEESTGDFHA